jgi:hypothetical protein
VSRSRSGVERDRRRRWRDLAGVVVSVVIALVVFVLWPQREPAAPGPRQRVPPRRRAPQATPTALPEVAVAATKAPPPRSTSRTLTFFYARDHEPASGLAVEVAAFCDDEALDAGVPSVVASGTTDDEGKFPIPGADAACELSATLDERRYESTVWDDDTVDVFPREVLPVRLSRPVRVFVRDRAQRPIAGAEVIWSGKYEKDGDLILRGVEVASGEFVFTEHYAGAGLLIVDAPAFARTVRKMVVLESGDVVATLSAARAVVVNVKGPARLPRPMSLTVLNRPECCASGREIMGAGRYEFSKLESEISVELPVYANLASGVARSAEVPPGEAPAELTLEVLDGRERRLEVFIEGYADFLRGQDRYQSALRELPPGSMPPRGVWHDVVIRCPGLELPRMKRVYFDVSDKGSRPQVVDLYAPRGPCEVGLTVTGSSLELVPEYETATVDPPGAVHLRLRR